METDLAPRTQTKGFLLFVFFLAAFPLVTGWNAFFSNQAAFFILGAFASIFSFLLVVYWKKQPFELSSTRKIFLVSACAIFLYALALLGVTYGWRWEPVFLVLPWIGVFAVLFRPELQEKLFSSTTRRSLGIFALIFWIHSVITVHQHTTFLGSDYRRTGLAALGCCLAIFFACVSFVRTRRQVEILLFVLVISGAISSAVAILQYFSPWDFSRKWFFESTQYRNSYGTMGHHNWFGAFLCLVIPVASVEFLRAQELWKRCFFGVASAVLFGGLLVSLSRGAWVACAFFFLILVVAQKKLWKRWAVLFAIQFAVTGILLPTGDWAILKRAQTAEDEAKFAATASPMAGTGRFGFWQHGLKYLPQYWLVGSGPDTFGQLTAPDEPVFPTDKAHSIYVEYAVTTGILGLVSYLVFLFSCHKRRENEQPSLVAWGLFAALLTYCVQGFFIHDTIHVWPVLWLLSGLAVVVHRKESADVG